MEDTLNELLKRSLDPLLSYPVIIQEEMIFISSPECSASRGGRGWIEFVFIGLHRLIFPGPEEMRRLRISFLR